MMAIQAGMLLPALSRARGQARRVSCANNLRQIGMAMAMYSETYDDRQPYDERGPLHSLSLLYPDWIDDPKVFICPSTDEDDCARFPADTSLDGLPCSYGYDRETSWRSGPLTPLVADMPGNHGGDGINVLYLDAHFEFKQDSMSESQPGDDIFTADDHLPPDLDAYIRQE